MSGTARLPAAYGRQPWPASAVAVAGTVIRTITRASITGNATLLGIRLAAGHVGTPAQVARDPAALAKTTGGISACAFAANVLRAEARSALVACGAGRTVTLDSARSVYTRVGRLAIPVALAAGVASFVGRVADVIATVFTFRSNTLASSVAGRSRRCGRARGAGRRRAVLALVPVGAYSGLASAGGSTGVLQGDFALLLRVGRVIRHRGAPAEGGRQVAGHARIRTIGIATHALRAMARLAFAARAALATVRDETAGAIHAGIPGHTLGIAGASVKAASAVADVGIAAP